MSIKTKKITVKDFKKKTNNSKDVLNNNNKEVLNNNKLVPYERIITDNLDDVYYNFVIYMNEKDLVSEDDLKFKTIKEVIIKITSQLKRQNTQERRHWFMILMVM